MFCLNKLHVVYWLEFCVVKLFMFGESHFGLHCLLFLLGICLIVIIIISYQFCVPVMKYRRNINMNIILCRPKFIGTCHNLCLMKIYFIYTSTSLKRLTSRNTQLSILTPIKTDIITLCQNQPGQTLQSQSDNK